MAYEEDGLAVTVKRPTVPPPARRRPLPLIARFHLRDWALRLLDRFPPLGEPLEGLGARVGFWFVVACGIAYTVYMAAYLFAEQNAWQTHAEDMGIMTQALWNTTHGALLHQTICNIVSDTNCIGDVSRFAIHFEPIMLPIALIYAIAPQPQTLQLLQAAVVASGALPAYWLASRRLRSALAGVACALLYLWYPPLQSAVTYDFHAVTLAAAFLMFALYFMMTRNNWGLFIACLLAMSTKEEIPLDVIMIAFCVALFQRRWKIGAGLAGLAVVWLVVELIIMRAASPLGYSPTASRYAQFGSSPVQVAATLLTHPINVLRDYVFDSSGVYYLRTLLSGVGYIAILSPWSLLIAAPAIAINLLSSDASMRSGLYQYSAEITPVIIFATIDAFWWLSRLSGWLATRLTTRGWRWARWPWGRVALAGLTVFVTVFGAYSGYTHGQTPITQGVAWPESTAHTDLANQLITLIPPNASVSAQSDLVPHLSDRRYIYLFPYQSDAADYVFLDVTGRIYPDNQRGDFAQQVMGLLHDTDYHVIAAKDGYLLFKRGAGPALAPNDPQGLPTSFFTFVTHPRAPHIKVNVQFGKQLQLVGYTATYNSVTTSLRVITYWQVSAPLTLPTYPEIDMVGPTGATLHNTDFPATEWLPMTDWLPGSVYEVDSGPLYVASAAGGQNAINVRVFSTFPGPQDKPQPVTVSRTVNGLPMVTDDGTGATLTYENVR